MLNHFPTPYEDELFHSVIARYHKESGNPTYSTTTVELFGNHYNFPSLFYARKNFGGLFEKLPQHLFNKQEFFWNHTLVPYLMRFQPAHAKQAVLSYVTESDNPTVEKKWYGMNTNTHMRYCPKCNKADEENYGEMYWHRSHQIKAMPLCPFHGCRLENSKVEVTRYAGRYYYLPSKENCQSITPNFDIEPYEKQLTRMLHAFLVGKQAKKNYFWRSVLMQALANANAVKSNQHIMAVTVWEGMVGLYGEDLVAQYFHSAKEAQKKIHTMAKGAWKSPEHYALLGVWLGLQPEALITPEYYLEDITKTKLLEMSKRDYQWSKQRAADEVGVTTWKLESITKRLGIKPFWQTFSKTSSEDDIILRIRVTRSEQAQYQKRADELGTANLTEFMKYCTRKEIKESQQQKPV